MAAVKLAAMPRRRRSGKAFESKVRKDFREVLESLRSLCELRRWHQRVFFQGKQIRNRLPFFGTARDDANGSQGGSVDIMTDGYKYEVTSLVGFLQRVATHLLPHGYWFFTQGVVPKGKDPAALDAKLLAKYDVAKTEGARRWRKSQGLGNVQYVRFDHSWMLLATHGDHAIREGEGTNLKDVRRVPIRIGDYSVYVKRGNYLKKRLSEDPPTPDGRWRVRVLIAREPYRVLCAYFLSIACHRRAEALADELFALPHVPYAPVRKQLLKLLRLINAKRQAAGYAKIPVTCLRFKRQIVKAFEPSAVQASSILLDSRPQLEVNLRHDQRVPCHL